MTKWPKGDAPHPLTIKCIDLLQGLFTERDKNVLTIERNGQRVTIGEQFLARWWNFIPLADNPLMFKAKALQLLATHGRLIDLLEKVQQEDIFAALLDPENYKEKVKLTMKSKDNSKKQTVTGASSANVSKVLSRMVQGDGALGVSWDYTKSWDEADRARLDNLKIQTSDKTGIVDTKREQEEGDDTQMLSTDIKEESIVDEKERLDYKNIEQFNIPVNSVSFQKSGNVVPSEKDIRLHAGHVIHNVSSTGNEKVFGANSFQERLNRHNMENLRERIILAEALNNIQNLEFIDLREKLYRYFDPLFFERRKPCHF